MLKVSQAFLLFLTHTQTQTHKHTIPSPKFSQQPFNKTSTQQHMIVLNDWDESLAICFIVKHTLFHSPSLLLFKIKSRVG